jgi:hypothetical protein
MAFSILLFRNLVRGFVAFVFLELARDVTSLLGGELARIETSFEDILIVYYSWYLQMLLSEYAPVNKKNEQGISHFSYLISSDFFFAFYFFCFFIFI